MSATAIIQQPMGSRMKHVSKWFAVSILLLVFAACAVLWKLGGSPRDAYNMVRYALPHMHRGSLHPGDAAPDVRLIALDGTSRFHLRKGTGSKPLVLIFGSFT